MLWGGGQVAQQYRNDVELEFVQQSGEQVRAVERPASPTSSTGA
jgi:hypothetical protein